LPVLRIYAEAELDRGLSESFLCPRGL